MFSADAYQALPRPCACRLLHRQRNPSVEASGTETAVHGSIDATSGGPIHAVTVERPAPSSLSGDGIDIALERHPHTLPTKVEGHRALPSEHRAAWPRDRSRPFRRQAKRMISQLDLSRRGGTSGVRHRTIGDPGNMSLSRHPSPPYFDVDPEIRLRGCTSCCADLQYIVARGSGSPNFPWGIIRLGTWAGVKEYREPQCCS